MDTYQIAIGPALTGKLLPGDPYWREFNGAFKAQQLTSDMVASAIYDAHAFTTVCEPAWRKAENYKLGQHLALDFDTEDVRSTIPQLLKDAFVARYASILYTTPSHSPDKPRARVVFLLDTPIMQAHNYTRAAAALLWLFGTADRQCKDPVRFFYGGKPGGASEVEWRPQVLPLSVVRDIIARYETTGKRERQRVQRTFQAGNASEQEIADALKAIPPWGIDYDEWLAVLMALHSELGDGGLTLAEAWADGQPGEVERKWRGFRSVGNASGRVGIGTLFALAKAHGWERRSA